ncbi:hypothetical protein KY386_04010 [Candidatus Parcubacteria bacterium]|nr:hypothetical protein [Candidatus Parcubacteria bacterium]
MEKQPQPSNERLPNHDELEPNAESLQNRERSPETPDESAETQAERVELARAKLERHEQPPPPQAETEAAPKPHPTRLDKAAAYAQTLASLQRRLTPGSRAFSRLIHAPAVESASEALGKTVARPSVTLGATLTSLLVGGFFYLTARRYGFVLSGSEFVLSLLAGAVLGLVAEGVFKLFRRARS